MILLLKRLPENAGFIKIVSDLAFKKITRKCRIHHDLITSKIMNNLTRKIHYKRQQDNTRNIITENLAGSLLILPNLKARKHETHLVLQNLVRAHIIT